MIRLTYVGSVLPGTDGVLRLAVENKSYPGQMFAGEDLDLLFKTFPAARMSITVDIELAPGQETPQR